MTSLLSHIASVAGRRPRAATLAVLLALVAVVAGAVTAGGTFKDDFTVPGIDPTGPGPARAALPRAVRHQATLVFTGALERGEIRAGLDEIRRQPHVVAVEDPFNTGRRSEDGHTAYATVSYDKPADQLDDAAREGLEAATSGLPRSMDVAMSGEVVDGAATGGFPVGELMGWRSRSSC